MQDIDRFLESGDIHDPEDARRIAQTNLSGAWSNRVERLPVIGRLASLDLAELEPGFPTWFPRKLQQIVVRRSYLSDFLFDFQCSDRIKSYTYFPRDSTLRTHP